MNNDVYEIIKKHHIHPISYTKKGNVNIINDKNRAYVIKLNTSNYDVYKYLESRDFINFPENYNNSNDNYDLSEYIKDINTSKEQKINDLITILSILHHKTSYIREIDLDEIKNIYEDAKEKILKAKDYYIKINDLIDKEIFLSPSMYLLVRNISLIYYMLEYASLSINKWYDIMKDKKSARVALLHNNIDIDNLLINNDKYLINWDKAYFDNPIFDIESFYRKYYNNISLNEVLKIYELKNKLSDEEVNLLLIKLAIPKIIEFTDNTFNDTKIINKEIVFLKKIYDVIKKDESIIKKKNI